MAEVLSNRQKHIVFEQVSNQSCNKNDDINNLFKIFHQNIKGIKEKICSRTEFEAGWIRGVCSRTKFEARRSVKLPLGNI